MKTYEDIVITPTNILHNIDTFRDHLELQQSVFEVSNPTVSRKRKYEYSRTEKLVEYFMQYADVGRIGGGTYDIQNRHLIVVKQNGIYLASAIVLHTYDMDTGLYIYEIWSVLSNPNYIRSGAVMYMFLNMFKNIEHKDKTKCALNVWKDNYPFIQFQDRLYLYASLGFSTLQANKTIYYLVKNEQRTLNTSQLKFLSKYHRGSSGFKIILNGVQMEKADFMQTISSVLVTQMDIPFYTDTMNEYYISDKDIAFYKNKPLNRLPNRLPSKQYAFLSHSVIEANIIADNMYIRTFDVPEDVEIVVFNTLGFSTLLNTVGGTWDAILKYFSNFSIEKIQQLFPPFKSGIEGIDVSTMESFYHNTSNGIFINLAENDYHQIHAYGPGDKCPIYKLGIYNYMEKMKLHGKNCIYIDPTLGVYGLYTINKKDDYRNHTWRTIPRDSPDFVKRMPRDDGCYYTPFENPTAYTKDTIKLYLSGLGAPNQSEDLIYPTTDADYTSLIHKLYTGDKMDERSYDDIIRLTKEPGKRTRYYIVSCASLDLPYGQPSLERKIQSYFSFIQENRQYHPVLYISPEIYPNILHSLGDIYYVDAYRKLMQRVGESMYDLFKGYVPSHLSPASIYRVFSRNKEIEQKRTRRGSRGTLGTRVSARRARYKGKTTRKMQQSQWHKYAASKRKKTMKTGGPTAPLRSVAAEGSGHQVGVRQLGAFPLRLP